ncbi:hypothetical protein NIIDNTM18_01810 [Mycolicibacterium litorale]|uniref:G domain-containing protein n=1 Tax=Mycolicibacterium litorale TaxID=758802 RepID=A0A6S6NV97_9MYCO|nr:hypothetical protein NIIDNTM18_01810 [Mycolicibacterium litorale]
MSGTGRRREGAAIFAAIFAADFAAEFADVLTRFAQDCGDARVRTAVSAVAARVSAPLRVAVQGRAGVGRTTLARVLDGAGRRIVDTAADVAVVVVAEVVKPEDRAAVARWRDVPVLVVCNKADLTGPVPLEALRRAAGAPVVPAVALLADVRLDHEAVDALRTLTAAHPGDSADSDVRLVRLLGRYGIARAVAALRDGADPSELPGLLRGLSGLDGVVAHLDALTAPSRYRRVRAALTDLQALATGSDAVAGVLAGDEAVLAVMTAAVDVVQAAGLVVDPADDPAAHLRRAVRWRRYSRGPVSPLHRACGADISRGSLRLFERHR